MSIFSAFLISLLVTVVVYTVPIIFYRFGIKKSAIPRKKAKRITIIYGICSFIFIAILISALGGSSSVGSIPFLWIYINYRILISGRIKPDAPKPAAAPESNRPVRIWQRGDYYLVESSDGTPVRVPADKLSYWLKAQGGKPAVSAENINEEAPDVFSPNDNV